MRNANTKPIELPAGAEELRHRIFNDPRFKDIANANSAVIGEIKQLVQTSHESQIENHNKVEKRIEGLDDRLGMLEANSDPARPGRTLATSETVKNGVEHWTDLKSGERVPILSRGDSLAALEPNRTGITMGQWLRAIITGRHDDSKENKEIKADLATVPDSAGGYTLPRPLLGEFIDYLKSRIVLAIAGMRVVPMSSKTLSIAKVVSPPSVGWYAENASITPSDPTLGVVNLVSKTIVGVVKMSLELSQDSINIEQILFSTLASSVATEIDRAGLANTTSNGPSGILSFTDRNQITSVGTLTSYDPFVDGMGALLDSNIGLQEIGPIILGTAAFTQLAKLKTGLTNDKTPLVKPAVLTMPFLPTTSVQTGSPQTSTAYMGRWQDLLFGVRRDVTIRILNEAFLASSLSVAVLVYMRVDFQPTHEESFATLEGIDH